MANTGRNAAIVLGAIILLIGVSAAAASPEDTEPDDDDDDGPPINEPPPRKPGFDPGQPTGPFQPPKDPIIFDPIAIVDDPPLVDIIKEFPTGGTFYQALKGDILLGKSIKKSIVYRWLRTEAFLAAQKFGGLGNDAANAFAKKVSDKTSNRTEGLDIIQCAFVNDANYGTWGYGPKAVPSPHGRALRMIRHHPDNLQRLRDGKPLARNIELGNPSDKKKGNAFGVRKNQRDEYELLWLPKLNGKILWESDGTTLTTAGENWPDGSSKMNPPPWVLDRGIDDFSESGFDDWGC